VEYQSDQLQVSFILKSQSEHCQTHPLIQTKWINLWFAILVWQSQQSLPWYFYAN
jgi:hypothetical protein